MNKEGSRGWPRNVEGTRCVQGMNQGGKDRLYNKLCQQRWLKENWIFCSTTNKNLFQVHWIFIYNKSLRLWESILMAQEF